MYLYCHIESRILLIFQKFTKLNILQQNITESFHILFDIVLEYNRDK